MKLIGRGWQYSVYDIGNGRVLKRYNTLLESYKEMLKEQLLGLRLPILGFTKIYREVKEFSDQSLKKVINSNLDQSMFGNPKIVSNLEYEQDYIEPLSSYFENHSVNESKEKIDSFVKFCTLLHKNSLIEKNFNMGDNFGLNTSEEVVLMDLGEICTSQEEISSQITKRVWSRIDVLSKFPASLHEYFIHKMDERFAVTQLPRIDTWKYQTEKNPCRTTKSYTKILLPFKELHF